MSQLVANIVIAASLNLLLGLSFYPGYHTTRFFNVSHAFLPTCAGYVLFVTSSMFGIPLVGGIILGAMSAGIAAVILQVLFFAPMRRREFANWQLLVASLGIYAVLVNAISMCFGDETRLLKLDSTRREILGAGVSDVRLMIFAFAVLGFGLVTVILQRTALGRAVRAVSSNPDLAEILGVSIQRTSVGAMGLGGLLAGITGVLVALDNNVTPTMGFRLLINGAVTMILAGVGNVSGLIFGAILLAAGQHLVAYYFESKWMDALAFAILIGFLIWKPLGWSGRRLRKIEV